MKAYEYDGEARDNCREIPIPDDLKAQAEEYRDKLMDEVAEVSDELMEHYLEGEEISHEECVTALKKGVTEGRIFPVTCGVATKNLGTNRLLDALVEDLPSPKMVGRRSRPGDETLEPDPDKEMVALVFKTLADPFAGRINLFRVYQGTMTPDTHVHNCRAHHKERIGQLLVPQGKEMAHAERVRPGRHGRGREAQGDALGRRAGGERPRVRADAAGHAVGGHGVRDRGEGEGRRGQGLHRAAPPPGGGPDDRHPPRPADRRADRRRPVADPRRGDRRPDEGALRRRGQPQAAARARTARRSAGSAKAHGRYKKQTGGRGQFGDCHIEIEPLPDAEGFEFVNKIKGGVIPTGFIPAVEKGVVEAMEQGIVAGCPMKGVRVTLYDGSYHSVDSSENGVQVGRVDGVQAGRRAGAARCCSSRS